MSRALFDEGRSKVAAVLRPLLGDVLALERATAIAQALVDGCGDPETIARERLSALGAEQRRRAAAKVAGLWLEVQYAIARYQSRAQP